MWHYCKPVRLLLSDIQKTMKIEDFFKGLNSSVIKLLQGCSGIEVVPLCSGLSGTLEVKPGANDKGWHFLFRGSHIQRWHHHVGRRPAAWAGHCMGLCFPFPKQPPALGTGQSPAHAPAVAADPSQGTGGSSLCQRSVNNSLHPLDLAAHPQKRDDDYLLCKVLWDLLEISAFERADFPFLSKAESSSDPAVAAFALQHHCLRGEAGHAGDTAVGNIIEKIYMVAMFFIGWSSR